MIQNFQHLRDAAAGKGPVPMAVAMANDPHVIESVSEAAKQGLVRPILVGPVAEVEALVKDIAPDMQYEIVEAKDKQEASVKATQLVSGGSAQILMKGLVDTSIILHEVLNKEYGLRTGNILSHVGVVKVDAYPKLLFISDGAMLIAPNAEQKEKLIENALPLMHSLGIEKPKVAILAAKESVSDKMQATLDAQILVDKNQSGEIADCVVEGPFALDNAIDKEAASIKGIQGEVVGEADLLVAPQIESGNILYKSLVYLAGAESAGLITGATHPIVLTSRADSAEAKLNSIALAVLVATKE